MKQIFTMTLAALLLFSFGSCNRKASVPELKTQSDTLSWVIGESYALGLQEAGLQYDKEMILRAIEATLDGKEQPIDDAAYREALNYLNGMIAVNQRQKAQQGAERVQSEEKAYFEKLTQENPNVKRAPSGFYYEVLKEGTGRKAAPGLVVYFDYKAMFTNGEVYDQTYGNREPITHVVGVPMFQGMQDALSMMRAGSIYRCYFPSELAFGGQGTEDIPPYTTLIYEIDLKEVRD